MVRDPARLLAALVLSAGLLAPAGCVGARGALREVPGYVPAPEGEGPGAAEALPLSEYRRVHGAIGGEGGEVYLSSDDWGDEFKDGVYYGARYSRMLGLNWGLSVTAGSLQAEAKTPGEDQLEIYLARATLELGSYLGTTLCRWYFGGGAGYSFSDERDLSALGLGILDDEPTSHVVVGFEFRNETMFATRVEGSHTWLQDSGADHWAATASVSLEF